MNNSKLSGSMTLHSLYYKWVFLATICTLLIIASVLLFVTSIKSHSVSDVHKWIPQLIEYNVVQIGNQHVIKLEDPPTFEKALRAKKELGILIRHKGPNSSWSTSDLIPPFEQFDYEPIIEEFGMRIVKNGIHDYLLVKAEQNRFLVIMGSDYERMNAVTIDIIKLLLRVLAIFIVSALILRWILNPIKHLSSGLEKIRLGHFHHRLPIKSNDELGDLSNQFNLMAHQIERMLQSRKQLFFDMSHELRSPLTRMRISLEGIPEGPEKKEIKYDIVEMDNMLTKLLDSARSEYFEIVTEIKTTDIIEIIKAVVKQAKHRQPGIILNTSLTEQTLPIDPNGIRIVLNNLVDNALKFSTGPKTPVSLTVRKESDWLKIMVKDFGTGIPGKHVPHLFEPFYRSENAISQNIEGHGIGLNLCKKIIDAHKGKIHIKSVEGEGTEVTVMLPLNAALPTDYEEAIN